MKSWPLLIAVIAIQGSCFLENIQAQEQPVFEGVLQVTIDGEQSPPIDCYYEEYEEDRGRWIIGTPGYEDWVWQTTNPEGGSVSVKGMLDPDPEISFSNGVIDFGGPSNFSFVFILPLSPQVMNPSVVFDSLTGTVTNGGLAGLTVTANPPPLGIPEDTDGVTELQVYTLSDNNQATWKNVGLDAGPTQNFPGLIGAATYGPVGGINQGPIPTIPVGGVGAWTHMRVDLNFGLTGGNDAFSFSGAKVLVPEPSGVLLALGAIAAGYLCRRRG
jgi:hypothetical protein